MLANFKWMFLIVLAATASAETVRFKERCLKDVVSQVPQVLASQDKKTGRFGKGIWIVTDQNAMLGLAAAWSQKDPANPWYHKPELLDSIMSAGDALIEDMDANGQWEFRKKDGSTWGQIYMPWIYSRWIRSYALVREAMPPDRRARWDKALLLGYTGIAKEVGTFRIQNIPAHHAMGLYFAGKLFDRPAWRDLATEYLHKVAATQHKDGYWSEHMGPVVSYGFVYVDALGVYESVSKDEAVLPALRKTAQFHAYFTYPDGTDVETVDERNPYHGALRLPNAGFTFSPDGRSYLARQIAKFKGALSFDDAALLLLYGEEGEGASQDLTAADFDFVLGSGDAAVRRRGPWFMVVSTMTAEVPASRWIQDRQNFVSVYHDKYGLILGGGNTKLQPRWSNFTAGDVSLLSHRAGDENPKFIPPDGIRHIPKSAKLINGDDFGLTLDYGGLRGEIRLQVLGPDRLAYIVSGDPALTAHVTLLPQLKQTIASELEGKQTLSAAPIAWDKPGAWLDYRQIRISLPPGASVRWPVIPHDPYKKDGAADASQARIVIDAPAGEPRKFVIAVVK
jgi:hypothetical protein